MSKNFKRKPYLIPPKEGNRKSIFPKITKESNLAYGTSLILCSFGFRISSSGFRVGFSTLNCFQYFNIFFERLPFFSEATTFNFLSSFSLSFSSWEKPGGAVENKGVEPLTS